MPVRNPATTGKSHTFRYAGKVDKVEKRKVVDWKHCGDPPQFIAERVIAYQAELYALGLREAGIEIEEYEYRLIVPPGIKFCEVKHIWAVMKKGRVTALRKFDNEDDANKFAVMQNGYVEHRVTGDDGCDAYEERCYDWIHERPERMVSHPLQILEHRLAAARAYIWDCSKRVLDCRRNGRWLPNALACRNYNRVCPCAPLCEAQSTGADVEWLINEQYKEIPSPHPELGDMGVDRELLTYSSMTTLCQCEAKYDWQYERRLRTDADTSDPLWRGSAIHIGLEVYATEGREAALAAIDEWAERHPVLGGDWRKQEQEIAKARAMVRAAADKWPFTECAACDGEQAA
jgi:hypothetical protein